MTKVIFNPHIVLRDKKKDPRRKKDAKVFLVFISGTLGFFLIKAGFFETHISAVLASLYLAYIPSFDLVSACVLNANKIFPRGVGEVGMRAWAFGSITSLFVSIIYLDGLTERGLRLNYLLIIFNNRKKY